MYLFYSCVTNLCNLIASRDINFIKMQVIKKILAEVPPLILTLKAKSGTGKHKTTVINAGFFFACWGVEGENLFCCRGGRTKELFVLHRNEVKKDGFLYTFGVSFSARCNPFREFPKCKVFGFGSIY